jgi:hypothetical protein
MAIGKGLKSLIVGNPKSGSRSIECGFWETKHAQTVIRLGPCASVGKYKVGIEVEPWFSSSLVLGHVLSPVRFLPRHSFLLIANYTS